ncbi:hypothetical protein RI367_006368 [Sorochytrium milnesiophthora]
MSTTDLRTWLARLPAELVEHILALTGIEAVAAARQLHPLRRMLESYLPSINCSTRIETAVATACVRSRWSAGLQLFYDFGLDGDVAWDDSLSLCLDDIRLRPDTVDSIARRGGYNRINIAVCLTYNMLASGVDVSEMVARHCHRSCAFANALPAELIRRGGNIDELRLLWQKCDMYESDRDLAHTFIPVAAQHGNMALLMALDRAHPDLATEGALYLNVAYPASLEAVQYLYERAYDKYLASAVRNAMAESALDAVLWLLEQKVPGERHVHVDAAEVARGGHLPLLQHLWTDQDGVQGQASELARMAAAGNHTHVLDWLYSTNPSAFTQDDFTVRCFHDTLRDIDNATIEWLATHTNFVARFATLAAVCRAGRFDCAKWMWSTYPATRSVDVVAPCVVGGGLELAQWMLHQLDADAQQRLVVDEMDIVDLTHQGHERALHWLQSRHPIPVTETVIQRAIGGGNLNLAKWLHSLNPAVHVTQFELEAASKKPNLAMVQWVASLLPPGTRRYEDALIEAAANGCIENVHWLHQQCTPGYSTSAVDVAAACGHCDIAQYLHEQHVAGWTTEAMDRAAKYGDLELVKWLHQNRPEGCTTDAMDQAAERGHLHVVRWLHENRTEGCTTAAMDQAARYGHARVVRFLHAHRSEGCTTDAMDGAAACGDLDLVKWFHANRPEGCTANAMREAARQSHLSVIQFLHDNGYDGCTLADVGDARPRVCAWFERHRP